MNGSMKVFSFLEIPNWLSLLPTLILLTVILVHRKDSGQMSYFSRYNIHKRTTKTILTIIGFLIRVKRYQLLNFVFIFAEELCLRYTGRFNSHAHINSISFIYWKFQHEWKIKLRITNAFGKKQVNWKKEIRLRLVRYFNFGVSFAFFARFNFCKTKENPRNVRTPPNEIDFNLHVNNKKKCVSKLNLSIYLIDVRNDQRS